MGPPTDHSALLAAATSDGEIDRRRLVRPPATTRAASSYGSGGTRPQVFSTAKSPSGVACRWWQAQELRIRAQAPGCRVPMTLTLVRNDTPVTAGAASVGKD